jgi:hypothetical protein
MMPCRALWVGVLAVGMATGAAVCAKAINLPAGTELTVRLDSAIVPGEKGNQKFSADLFSSVFINGQEVLPMGSRIEGEVRGTKKSVVLSPRYLFLPNGKRLDFNAAISAVNGQRLKAEAKEGTVEKKGGDKGDAAQQASEIGLTGAVIGAMSTGTMTGMGIGAAAGAGAVLIGRKIAGSHGSTVIPAGTQLTLSLSRPMQVPDDVSEARSKEPTDPEDRRPILRRDD